MLQKQSQTNKQYADGKWWEVLLNNTSGILLGTAAIVKEANTKDIKIQEHYINENRNFNLNSSVVYIIIGLVLAIGIVVFTRK